MPTSIRQRIPGAVDKATALTSPETAAADQRRQRLAAQHRYGARRQQDDGAARATTAIEFGAVRRRSPSHAPDLPVARLPLSTTTAASPALIDERADRRLSQPLHRRRQRAQRRDRQPAIRQWPGGGQGALLSSSLERSANYSVYVENRSTCCRNSRWSAAGQFLFAARDRRDRFFSNGDQSGSTRFSLFSPKAGFIWDVDPAWQVFGNVSRSVEVPSFGEGSGFPAPTIPFTSLKPQTAIDLRDRHARPAARPHLGHRGLSRRYSQRAAVHLRALRQLQRHQRRQDRSSGRRSGRRRRHRQRHAGARAGAG